MSLHLESLARHVSRQAPVSSTRTSSSIHSRATSAQRFPPCWIAKLLLSELGHEAAAIMAELAGPDGTFLEGPAGMAATMAATMVLMNRAMSIAGGTSEIKRNQIAERILGLPRDPLIR
jgi:alkylation response protein AidB-like acyl-CoA dehydrogenase